jgi:hypothetical protein
VDIQLQNFKEGILVKTKSIFTFLLIAAGVLFVSHADAQRAQRETYTGTVVSYGTGLNVRTSTGTFTLTVDRQTSDERAQQLLGLLQQDNDDDLLREVRREDVGSFSINGRIGPRVNVVRETMVNGQRRIFAVFERWQQFAELRGGYRSLDYPFGVLEIYIDPRTGKGSGTYVAAARVRWRNDKKTGQNQIEIENFATFPARLMGVQERGRRLS